jgi:hypothetical protein
MKTMSVAILELLKLFNGQGAIMFGMSPITLVQRPPLTLE